jgi:DNA-binding HxlR family transcriptional regulator
MIYICLQYTKVYHFKMEGNFIPLSKECQSDMKSVQDTLYVLSGKWKMLIILSLRNGNKRYREISRSIPGITLRMLSKELKEMELNKLVVRTVYTAPSVLVEYTLTEYSETLWPIVSEMIRWAKDHRKVIM